MKKIFCIFLLSISFNAFSTVEYCYFDGDDFFVISEGQSYRQSVDDYEDSLYNCRGSLAAIYDGDDLYVFNGKTKQFSRQGVDDYYLEAKLEVGRAVVAMYDGDDLYVYNIKNEDFDRQGVDDNYSNSILLVRGNSIGFYDGDDVYAYSMKTQGFHRQGVDDFYSEAALSGNRYGMLFYDGDDVFSYCNRESSWSRDSADDGEVAHRVRRGGLAVGGSLYMMRENCDVTVLD